MGYASRAGARYGSLSEAKLRAQRRTGSEGASWLSGGSQVKGLGEQSGESLF